MSRAAGELFGFGRLHPGRRHIVVMAVLVWLLPVTLLVGSMRPASAAPHDCRSLFLNERFLDHWTSESKWTGVRSQIWFPSGSSEGPCIQQVLVGLSLPNVDQTIWFGWFRGWTPYIDLGGLTCPFPQDYYTTVQLWAKIDGARGNPCVLLTPTGMTRGVYHNAQIVRSSTNSSVYIFKLDSTQVWSWNFGSAQSGYAIFAAGFRFYDSTTEPTTSDAGRWNNIQGKVGSNAWQKPLPALAWDDRDNVSGHNYVAQNLADGSTYLNECTHVSGGSCPGA